MHAQSWLTPATPWTVAHQAPLFMEFSGQEYWNGLTFLSVLFLGMYLEKKKKAMIFKKCALIFIAALFTVAKILKLPKWLSAEG